MKPFFCYYGGKWRIAPKYPPPVHDTIIEPFAGAAGYSVRHYQKKVKLYDLDEKICGVWEYLIKTPKEEILRLPLEITDLRQMDLCQEAKWLIGFWIGKGQSPRNTPSAWMRNRGPGSVFWSESKRLRLAEQSDKIRHWQIFNKSCWDIDNEKADWFIDPPYIGPAGNVYTKKFSEFERLAEWSKDRQGQVIVCEQAGAEWLPFRPFLDAQSIKGVCKEVIWTKPAGEEC